MTTATRLPPRSGHALATHGATALGVVLLAVAATWAATAGHDEAAAPAHASPVVVEHVEGQDVSYVTLSELGARKIGLEVVRVPRAAGTVVVPYAALVHDADGTLWVYASDEDDPLRFRRHEVVLHSLEGDRATLRTGPPAGSWVAGYGAAELHGSEFEVGH